MNKTEDNTTYKEDIPKKAYKTLMDGNYGYGISLLEDYIKENKNNPHVFNNLGAAYMKLGNYIEAEKYLNMALELPAPPKKNLYYNFIELNINIGNEFANKKNYNMAIFYFQRTLDYIYKYEKEIDNNDSYILNLKKQLKNQLYPKS